MNCPIEKGYGRTITEIHLSENGLAGNASAAIASLSKMYALRKLDLSSNKLTGPLLPGDKMINTDVNYLDLSSNPLTGGIPPKMDSLTDLSYLNLSHCQLSGPLADADRDWTDATTLDLSFNAFSGTISDKIQKGLTDTVYLHLSHNKLSGSVPLFLGGVSKLMQTMHLEHNQFNGSIPAELVEMNQLTELYFHANNLSGTVPSNLAQLGLTALRLDADQLSGVVPVLPFEKYTKYCAMNANSFKCPLPANSSSCLPGPPTCS
jgi:hypothetical protein